MATVTIVRKMDDLGRIVIPIELRRQLELECGQEVEMSCQGSTILLKKFLPSCVFCGGREKMVTSPNDVPFGRDVCFRRRKRNLSCNIWQWRTNNGRRRI